MIIALRLLIIVKFEFLNQNLLKLNSLTNEDIDMSFLFIFIKNEIEYNIGYSLNNNQ